ncbi:MAG: serine hydrolase [Candidatus Krumholzibacteria bacterium]|nr:serine hydrolase [Candidatus Krumholzibacteria bacterium]
MLSWLVILSVAFQFLTPTDFNRIGYTASQPAPAAAAPVALPLSSPEHRWAPLDRLADNTLQERLDNRLRGNDAWHRLIEEGRLAVGVVDLRDLDNIRFAAINGDVMFYAASLPKIAALLTAHEKLEAGALVETPELNHDLIDMIRVSSNRAATRVIDTVGLKAIRATVTNPRYRFYDESRGGGIWLGKRYHSTGPRYPDPVAGYSHAATVDQVCRFYYLLATGRLVSRERSASMLDALSCPGIQHKFCRALAELGTEASVYRKSGTWRNWHGDSVLVWGDDGRRYILAALVEDSNGEKILRNILPAVEDALSIAPGNDSVDVGGKSLVFDGRVDSKDI